MAQKTDPESSPSRESGTTYERYVVTLPYACYLIRVSDGYVVHAPPIGKWMIGNLFTEMQFWLAKKGGKLDKC